MQIPLKFESKHNYCTENYFVSASNKEAFDWLSKWSDWNVRYLAIFGAAKSGKTHLANIWQQKSGAIFLNHDFNLSDINDHDNNFIIENVSQFKCENALFHLYNLVNERDGYILFTDEKPLSQISFKLPDLISRLNSVPCIEVFSPDDLLLRIVLTKGFSDRQLKVNKDIIDYMMIRIERSFASVNSIIEKIDQQSLQEKRNITIPFIKTIID